MVENIIVKEWFLKGEKDIDDAEFLLENDRALENVAFHVHHALEKYIKGYLIYFNILPFFICFSVIKWNIKTFLIGVFSMQEEKYFLFD